MKFPFHLYHHLWRKKISQVKVLLHLCIIFIFMGEVALAADCGSEKKSFRLVNAISAKIPENKINIMKKDPRIKYIVNDSIFQASDEYSSSWGVQYIGSQPVHDQGINGSGVKIAAENNTAVFDAVNAAYNSGVLLVAAGGNTAGGPVLYPAAYDSVIAVTAIDQNGQRASFSPIDQKIEVAAPGVRINSTIQAGNSGRDNVYGYGILNASRALLGTSGEANADLSITKDDFVSRIIAGGGKTYNYNIIVKNNGPSDAPGVQVFDTWPGGFIRGTVITSQGTCDTAFNFTCDLGTMQKNGTANINVSYTVPDTSIGNYTNRVEVISTSIDNNAINNIAEDKNIVEIVLNLFVKSDLLSKDTKQVSLLKGDYSITITNNNLSKVDMNVYENGILRKDRQEH